MDNSFSQETLDKLSSIIDTYLDNLEKLLTMGKEIEIAKIYYLDILLHLIAARYQVKQFVYLKKLLNRNHDVFRSDSFELIETTLPKKLSVRLIEIFNKLLSSQQESNEGDPKKLFYISAWVKYLLITNFNLEGEFNLSEEHLIKKIHTVIFLKKIDLFANIPPYLLFNFTKIVHEEVFYKGDVLFKEGDPGDSMYIVYSGQIAVYYNGKCLATVTGGNVIGELSLIDNLPRSASAVVEEKTKVLRIDEKDFNNMLSNYPDIGKSLLKVISKRLRDTLAEKA